MTTIIFYDGVCGVCTQLVQYVIKHDKKNKFKFASIQSHYAKQTLKRYGKDTKNLTTLYVLDKKLLERSAAILFIFNAINKWKVLNFLPPFMIDIGYVMIAKTRRMFGKSCTVLDKKKVIA